MSRLNDCFRFGIVDRQLHGYRTEYDRDYGRVLHAPSFRRLAHKTQLFPSGENDFFRTRLTHSLEVAEIAAEIGRKLQHEMESRYEQSVMSPTFVIEPRVCEIAGLVHDLGHPPFGHNGERALNECMQGAGGFEGNAQTLHILMRLEHTDVLAPVASGNVSTSASVPWSDPRIGLNLTARSIASALKYDRVIPLETGPDLIKGYYETDRRLIDTVKLKLAVDVTEGEFKTIECSIMDIADDIAYSTYDMEDAFAGHFMSPLSMLSQDDAVFDKVASELEKDYDRMYQKKLTKEDCITALRGVFQSVFCEDETEHSGLDAAQRLYNRSELYTTRESYRTEQTSAMIDAFIESVSLEFNRTNPILSRAKLSPQGWLTINVLKKLNHQLIITSPMLRVAEYRGHDIVKQLFEGIYKSKGALLTDSYRDLFKYGERLPEPERQCWEKRVVCDFIASMSDRNAIEFHHRMYSSDGATIFKPL